MDRATYESLREHAEASTAKATTWALANLLPGEDLMTARKRYRQIRLPAERAAIKHTIDELARLRDEQRAGRPAPTQKEDRVIFIPGLEDDGQDDATWALDHSTRRYRVRPSRAADRAWFARRPAIAIFDLQTVERLVIPADIPGLFARDDDDFGAAVFAARDTWNEANA